MTLERKQIVIDELRRLAAEVRYHERELVHCNATITSLLYELSQSGINIEWRPTVVECAESVQQTTAETVAMWTRKGRE